MACPKVMDFARTPSMSQVGILDPSQLLIVHRFVFINHESIKPRNEASHSGAGCLLSQADAIAASHGCGYVHQPGRGKAEELRFTEERTLIQHHGTKRFISKFPFFSIFFYF